jgi:hypothetical protein
MPRQGLDPDSGEIEIPLHTFLIPCAEAPTIEPAPDLAHRLPPPPSFAAPATFAEVRQRLRRERAILPERLLSDRYRLSGKRLGLDESNEAVPRLAGNFHSSDPLLQPAHREGGRHYR